MKELTPWFRDGQKPAYIGVYQTVDEFAESGFCYQFWNGSQWNIACTIPEMAAIYHFPDDKSCYQNDAWRGLAKKP